MITGVLNHRTTLRLGIPLLAVLVGLGSIEVASVYREHNYKELLAAEVERRAFEVTAQTLNGNVMGAVANLGLVNQAMKNVATGKVPLNDPVVVSTLQAVGKLYEASGVFMVGQDGIVQSSWDSTGKRSTGLDVRFRPYFQIAMQGKQNVYAAVSLTTGSRALYFAAPLYREISTTAPIIGASVARVGLERVDSVLKAWPGHALLLSPQQIAFASSREDWIVQMAGEATPEQLQTIRALKQFGNVFETGTPKLLPFDISNDVISFEQRRYAVARAAVQWNDPNGEWTLVFMGDLDEQMPVSLRILIGSTSGAAVLLLGTIYLLWRRRLQQANGERQKAVDELKQYTSRLERDAEAKTRLTELSTRLHQATSIESFAQTLMSHISTETGIEYAAFYVYAEASGQLSPAGGYGVLAQQLQPFRLGQGLVGQCAKDRSAIRIADMANTGIHIVWGGGHIVPQTVLLLPVLNADRLGGVLVLASTGAIDQSKQTALEEVTAMAAGNLEILMRNLGIEQQALLLEKHQGMLRESESRQHEQNAMLQAIVDAIPYPVFYKGADTRFIGFNRAYEQAFSVRRDNLIGKRVLDLDYLPEADRIAYQKEDEEVISSTGKVEKKMSIPFADGKMHDTLYYVVGFTKTDGSPGGLVGTFIDVAVRNKA